MPIHLMPSDISPDLESCNSVLIVSCPICPPMSLAMQNGSPFLQFFKKGIKTPAFEDHIEAIREPLRQRGIRTGVFCSNLPCPTMCLWTKGQRKRLLKRAKDYDVVVVLGCDSATKTAMDTLKDVDCRVVQAMHSTGVANATVRFRFPLTIELLDKSYVGGAGSAEKVG